MDAAAAGYSRSWILEHNLDVLRRNGTKTL
jgi:hypothetical protein